MSQAVKRGFLVFWALYWTNVWVTNLFSGMQAAGWLDENWRFASFNYEAIVEAVGNLGGPTWLAGLLMVGVIVWQALVAILFWLAAARYGKGSRGAWGSVEAAFVAAFVNWGAFLLAGEIFIFYNFAPTHVGLFVAQAVSFMMIRMLPESEQAAGLHQGHVVRSETRTATVTVRRRAER